MGAKRYGLGFCDQGPVSMMVYDQGRHILYCLTKSDQTPVTDGSKPGLLGDTAVGYGMDDPMDIA